MDYIWHVFLPILICICSAGIGFFFAVVLGGRWHIHKIKPRGILRLAYDPDDPNHPAMGLMLENMDYILSNKVITLAIQRIGFPDQKDA